MEYYRFTRKNTPMSDWGHAMFAADRDAVAQCYGAREFLYSGDGAVDIADLKDTIVSMWEEDAELGVLPDGCGGIGAEDAYRCFAPEDIVMSAGAWDDGDALTWFFDRIAAPLGIAAVKTYDGAIVFDPDLIVAV